MLNCLRSHWSRRMEVSPSKGSSEKEVIMVDPLEAKRLAAKQMEAIKAKEKLKGSPTNPNSQAKRGPSETGNMEQTAKEARVQALAELTRAFNQKVSIIKMHFATRKILSL